MQNGDHAGQDNPLVGPYSSTFAEYRAVLLLTGSISFGVAIPVGVIAAEVAVAFVPRSELSFAKNLVAFGVAPTLLAVSGLATSLAAIGVVAGTTKNLAIPSVIASIIVNAGLVATTSFYTALLIYTHLNKLEPPLLPFLSDLSIPPPTPGNVSQSPDLAPRTLTAGAATGAVAVPGFAVSGGLAASWSASSTSDFQAQRLDATVATVTDATGKPVGTGAVELTADSPVAAGISGNNQYSVNGTGSLSFYGPAETNLGVSGDWDNYSATVTGNVSITLTVPTGRSRSTARRFPPERT